MGEVFHGLTIADSVWPVAGDQAEPGVAVKIETLLQTLYYPGKEMAIQPSGWVEGVGSVKL